MSRRIQMDPDRYQMIDLKRRVTALEKKNQVLKRRYDAIVSDLLQLKAAYRRLSDIFSPDQDSDAD